jgi:hypothetical protein
MKAFEQFGFIFEAEDTAKKNLIGTCPFCHAKGHFGIVKDDPNKKWNCFKCQRGGGFKAFIREIVELSRGKNLDELSKRRGIPVNILRSMNIGWINDRWIIPVYDNGAENILNIKIYDGTSFLNTAGMNSTVYGLWAIPNDYHTIYLTEGEWDALAMMSMVDDDHVVVLGVPGAGATLRPPVLDLFIGKSVWLFYDNDTAGIAGNKKSVALLTPIASEIRSIQWPKDTKDGWDVRDVLTKQFNGKPVESLSWLQGHSVLVNLDKNIQTPENIGEHVPHKLVYDTFGKWVHLSDSPKYDQKSTDIYDVIFGMAFANRIPGDPVWLYLCAPPGAFKTEPLMALSGGKLIEVHESFTPASLISGFNQNAVDPSLIPQFNGKLVIIKDGTVLFGLPENELKEILSILRGAFDGLCTKTFGNGTRRSFKSTFGLIIATTPIVEQYTEVMSSVGERFLTWRNWISEDFSVRYDHIKRALGNIAREDEMRKEISAISKRVLLSGFKSLPVVSNEIEDTIIKMSQWIAVMRGSVSRDKFRRNVLYKPFSEVGTRLSKEILKLLMGISIFKGEGSLRPNTMRIAKSIAWSSVSTRYAETLKAFLQKEVLTAVEAEKMIGLPAETVEMVMENMMMLGILKKIENMKWIIEPKFLSLTKGAKLL